MARDETPRKPLLRIFDLDPDRHRPLDGSYVQRRWVRLYRPGPLRAAGVVVLAVATTWVAMAGLVGVTAQRGLLPRLVAAVVAAGLISVVGWWTVRVLAAGVYVNDFGVRLLTIRRTVIVPWSATTDIRRIPDGAGLQVVIVLDNADDISTPLRSHGVDFLLRSEAFDMAALQLERWWSESQRPPMR